MKLARRIMMATSAVGMLFGIHNVGYAASEGDYIYTPYDNGGRILQDANCCNIFYLCDWELKPVGKRCPPGQYYYAAAKECIGEDWLACYYYSEPKECNILDNSKGYKGGPEGTCTAQSTVPYCEEKTPVLVTKNIPGGKSVTTTTTRVCHSALHEQSWCEDTCHSSVTYRCDCNAGYTANNQGTEFCNCKQCGYGFYIAGTLAAPYCQECPVSDGYWEVSQPLNTVPVSGTTASPNVSTSPTSCYLPTYLDYHNESGTFKINSDCHYSL